MTYDTVSVLVLKDCLCFSHDWKGTNFVVWQMNEYHGSWTKLLNVTYKDLQIHCVDEYLFPLMLCLLENGGILIVAKSDYYGSRGILYNQVDTKVEHIQISNNIDRVYDKEYVQSLISPC